MSRKLLLLLALHVTSAAAQDDAEESGVGAEGGGFESADKERRDKAAQYSYCEEKNCYDLLGVKRNSLPFAIKRAYRKFAAEFHPDKNPDPKAKEIFQLYARAYEVVSDEEMRKNYDYFLDHPIEFPMHFMRFGSGTYAPKTSPAFALALCVLLVSAMQYIYQLQRRGNLIEAAKKTRGYQARLKETLDEMAGVSGGETKPLSGKARQAAGSAKSGKKGGAAEELKKAAEEKLLEEMETEFGTPPSVYHTLLFCPAPLVRFVTAVVTNEPNVATRRALGVSSFDWSRMPEEERAELIGRELWVKEKLAEYVEEVGGGRPASPKKSAKALRRKGAKGPATNDD